MFDNVQVTVKAGDGGDGAVSFRREKYVPFGGPDGGDGGGGGDVVIVSDAGTSDLRAFRGKRRYTAQHGQNGQGRKKHGKRGDDLLLRVPVGTLVWERTETGDKVVIADLEEAEQQAVVARGGRGGLGNTHFASSTNQAPRIAQKGQAGEEKTVVLELRLIADAGNIGYPNAGKSTLLAAASAATPKIAGYPFTTLEPVLGVVEVGGDSLVLAEIPGLVEGAHSGRGLGHDFLRHAMRTKILLHLIDGTSVSPLESMVRVNAELGLFDAALGERPQLVAVNKIDLAEVQARLEEIREAFRSAGVPVHFVSAATGEGVASLMSEAMKMVKRATAEMQERKSADGKVFRPQPKATVSVHREGDTFVVVAPDLERIVARVDMTNPQVRQQLQVQLDRMGVRRALEKAGIKRGDKIRCGEFEWLW